ncbi:hypothetical protein O181_022404 [Austropuccinia psidii MF-1]|uniref:SAGA-associated factor 11 n=1 Tax=Austropuccinia psidii MF-1 TaxID=1389203 RepID=A0A9Q3CEP8_9BASI|nr:hypothetical protein [Austropuccinia psidii MF-1]
MDEGYKDETGGGFLPSSFPVSSIKLVFWPQSDHRQPILGGSGPWSSSSHFEAKGLAGSPLVFWIMDELVQTIFNGLLEEIVWKVGVLEYKRAKSFRVYSAEQEQHAIEKKSGNDKHHPEPSHVCPICGREVSAIRFAPHLSKCLGIGGRGLSVKKPVKSEPGEADSTTKSSSHPSSDPSTGAGKKLTGNLKRRGRPPKKPPAVTLTPAEHEALLSNAINNATQRLHLQGIGLPLSSSIKLPPAAPHPLSQSHVATPPPPKIKKKKKKKQEPTRHRSRNSSQASSSSDSEEEEECEGDEEGEEPEVATQERLTPARQAEEEEVEEGVASEHQGASIASPGPPPQNTVVTRERPLLKRRSSSQADSTDGSDSD